MRVYGQADVLVNIGNRAAEFLPSKTFEYIATGKPILHFLNGTTPTETLSKHPLIELVETDTERAEAFILSSAGKSVSYEEIRKIYQTHTSEHIQEILLTALD